ncbi:type II toxin-antitoxin system RelE/ParE family toxin [Fulvivirga maritima]|uniref:type II toxin-antitoxin system RelE/ParE family toxin n=1 Tax=Fulvivirga maritima TaxID=2904247 RepID=UPI001F23B652|nr:type II toxin-antitoxin system RelE/ParE family toxin [Fulvivirga maritima]UII29458.1 type II toxin-antitoxin system RelE/ParE family toxin [Fulvivirga maritima]
MENYKLSERAKSDLIRIHQYGVRTFGEHQADKYFYAFFSQFERIAHQPYLYQAVDFIRPGYRRCTCGVDNIYYRIKNTNSIEIMRIIGRQDIDEDLL